MDNKTLIRLEKLNQLHLTEEQRAETLAFFAEREDEMAQLDAVDTSEVERMVHVMPLQNVLREDAAIEPYDRERLLAGAPQAEEGYWQVPRTVE